MTAMSPEITFQEIVTLVGLGFIMGLLVGMTLRRPEGRPEKVAKESKQKQDGRDVQPRHSASPAERIVFRQDPLLRAEDDYYWRDGRWLRSRSRNGEEYEECSVCLGRGRTYDGKLCRYCRGEGYVRAR